LGGRTACPKPLSVDGGDIDLCCGDWNPRTCRDDNSVSVSSGDSPLIASQNRCASAIRRAFGGGRVGVVCDGSVGAMTGVRGGVAKPPERCVAAAVETDTVAMT